MYIGVNDKSKTINQIFAGVNGVAKLIYTSVEPAPPEPEPPKFELPTFTGSHTVFGDANSGRIEIYESGMLTLSPAVYDLFAVGGGNSGGANVSGPRGGGGSGYTATKNSYSVSNNRLHEVVIGAGGTNSTGGETVVRTITGQGVLTASSPQDRPNYKGGDGGSGGGAGSSSEHGTGFAGGQDGSNGKGTTSGAYIGGTGQGATTRYFGELGGTLYAGGGGGGESNSGKGGLGGGGNGGSREHINGFNGTPNTGGGGGGAFTNGNKGSGGSGIVIIRWNNAQYTNI